MATTKKKPTPAQLAARAKFTAMAKARAKAAKSKKSTAKKTTTKKVGATKKPASSKHTDTKSHNVKISVMSGYDKMSENFIYGGVYHNTLQLYLVKFANLSFSLWAVTGEGLKKALKHPEGKNQSVIVYRVKGYGIPKFEKMKISELKEFK